jgi:hypothetical protein
MSDKQLACLVFLSRLLSEMLPPLTQKGVHFYRWFYREHQTPPAPLYTAEDLEELARSLDDLNRDNQTAALAEWMQRQPIADACGVEDAIQTRIEQVRTSWPAKPEFPSEAIDSVRNALLAYARHMRRS